MRLVANKKFAADVPEEILDGFDKWVEDSGLVKRRALIAAMQMIQFVPTHVRDAVLRGDIAAASKYLGSIEWPQPEWMQSTSRRAATTAEAAEQALAESGRVQPDQPKAAGAKKRNAG